MWGDQYRGFPVDALAVVALQQVPVGECGGGPGQGLRSDCGAERITVLEVPLERRVGAGVLLALDFHAGKGAELPFSRGCMLNRNET